MDYNGEFVIAATAYIFTISLVDIISITVSVLVTVEAINYIETTLSGTYFASSKGRSKSEVDPYARPNQKKQGRENKNKNRQKSNYTPRNNRRDGKPAPPKHHTPSSDHQKFSQTRKTKLSMVYKRLG